MPASRTAARHATEAVVSAGCVISVWSRRSCGPERQSSSRSDPNASEASANTAAAAVELSAKATPMPTVCEPWPGKQKAVFMRVLPSSES